MLVGARPHSLAQWLICHEHKGSEGNGEKDEPLRVIKLQLHREAFV